MNLFVFGLGYSATHFVTQYGDRFTSITATRRSAEPANRSNSNLQQNEKLRMIVWDGISANPDAEKALEQSDVLLISVAPDSKGDPVIRHFGETIVQNNRLRTIVYLSTVGVYGNHDGARVNEDTPPKPISARSLSRLHAEQAWITLAQTGGKGLHILRLAGIYGPGRSALDRLRAGTARRIIKPGQNFNRIHVEDIAQAITCAFQYPHGGSRNIWNVTDDEPSPPQDVITFGANLLGIEPPPETPIQQANFSPMALSFYSENKRVSNQRLKEQLGVRLKYPTYREGLLGLLDQK